MERTGWEKCKISKMKKYYKRSDSSKPDRKTVERNRRMHMKALFCKLASLMPHPSNYSTTLASKALLQLDKLDYATVYIKELEERVEALKKKKQLMTGTKETNSGIMASTSSVAKVPVLEFRDTGTTIEVTLITSLDKSFIFYQAISVLEEEGARVVNAKFCTIGDKVFHTIHSQVISSRVGVDTPRLCKRLKELISCSSLE